MYNSEKNQISVETSHEWVFPGEIDFKSTSHYIDIFSGIDYGHEIIFDLRNTDHIHSSFIGFLIDLKEKTDRAEGMLVLRLSPSIQKLMSRINLAGHFTIH